MASRWLLFLLDVRGEKGNKLGEVEKHPLLWIRYVPKKPTKHRHFFGGEVAL